MSGRAEMSTTIHDREPVDTGSSRMSIALIGPNNSHRKTVAKALAGTGAKSVREFDDYPATLADVPRLMEQSFDVVMIDVDSDQSYAMALIESIANIGKTVVIAYSQRNDQSLVTSCLQAGARELLPLPDGNDSGFRSSAPSSAARPRPVPVDTQRTVVEEPTVVQNANAGDQVHLRPKGDTEPEAAPGSMDFNEWDNIHLRPLQHGNKVAEPSPRLTVAAKSAGNRVEKIVKDKREPLRITPVVTPAVDNPVQESPRGYAAAEPPKQPIKVMSKVDSPAPRKESEAQRREGAARNHEATGKDELHDSRTWDKLWERAPQPDPNAAEAIAREEESIVNGDENWENVWARTSAPAAPKAIEEPTHLEAAPEQGVPPALWLDAIEAETQPAAAGRVKTIEVPVYRYVEPEEGRKERHGSHLVILAMGFGVLVCLCWIYFMHPFGQKVPAVATHSPATVAAQPQVEAASISPAAKPVAGATLAPPDSTTRQPSLRPADAPTVAPVSSDEMDAQLAAPTMISGRIKTPAPTDEPPPPSGVAPAAMEASSVVPGGVFGNQKQVKVLGPPPVISEGVAAGMLIHKTTPVYPEFAKQGHLTGTVVLGATITKTGTIQNLHYISGPDILRNAAMDAVKTWRYRPYMLDHQPVAVDTTIRLVFSMDQP